MTKTVQKTTKNARGRSDKREDWFTVEDMTKKHQPLQAVTIKEEGERILLSGDWHGDVQRAHQVISAAKREGCAWVFVLGDFGYWEHRGDGVKDLDSINKFAARAGVEVFFLDGNHENHPLLWERYKDAPRNKYGFWEVRPFIHYIERGARWTIGATSFLALGGANSVDKDWRQRRESEFTFDEYGRRLKPTGVGTLWWATEDITEEDITKSVQGGPVEVMLTHDAPSGVVIPERKDQPESLLSREKVRRVLDQVKPGWVFHGHFHIRKTSTLNAEHGDVSVTGLGDNRGQLQSQLIVLEV